MYIYDFFQPTPTEERLKRQQGSKVQQTNGSVSSAIQYENLVPPPIPERTDLKAKLKEAEANSKSVTTAASAVEGATAAAPIDSSPRYEEIEDRYGCQTFTEVILNTRFIFYSVNVE